MVRSVMPENARCRKSPAMTMPFGYITSRADVSCTHTAINRGNSYLISKSRKKQGFSAFAG
jgi:hypothetical protein